MSSFCIHLPNLIQRYMGNIGASALAIPTRQLQLQLFELAEYAASLGDKTLDAMMIGLTLYEVSDPESKEFNPSLVAEYSEHLANYRLQKAGGKAVKND